jgi:hypothetical protein
MGGESYTGDWSSGREQFERDEGANRLVAGAAALGAITGKLPVPIQGGGRNHKRERAAHNGFFPFEFLDG